MNIENIGEETVALLYDTGLVRSISDLYKLKKEDILPLDRMAEKSANNIINSIEKSKEVSFDRVLLLLELDLLEKLWLKFWQKHLKIF